MRGETHSLGHGPVWSLGTAPESQGSIAAEPQVADAPHAPSLPVRWTTSAVVEPQLDVRGGVSDVVGAGDGQGQETVSEMSEPEPDAVARGWVVPPGGARVEALFVLAGTALGIGRVERAASPVWLNLDDLVNLDAIGEPIDGLTEVEITMEDRRVIGAGWPEQFCDAVVAQLLRSSGAPTATPGSPAATPHPAPAAAPDVPDQPVSDAGPVPVSPTAAPADGHRADVSAPQDGVTDTVAPSVAATGGASAPGADAVAVDEPAALQPAPAAAAQPAPVADAAGADEGSPSLELEDVVYLGGYPGQTKRRKKCTVRMSREALELDGPGDTHFRVGWDVVRTIEVQNSDEARFRMNTKIHRDASALVIECDQSVSILLEARDCPTIALRSAMSQLLAGLAVVVV